MIIVHGVLIPGAMKLEDGVGVQSIFVATTHITAIILIVFQIQVVLGQMILGAIVVLEGGATIRVIHVGIMGIMKLVRILQILHGASGRLMSIQVLADGVVARVLVEEMLIAGV